MSCLRARLNDDPEGVYGELKPYQDTKFIEWFTSTDLSLSVIGSVYAGYIQGRTEKEQESEEKSSS